MSRWGLMCASIQKQVQVPRYNEDYTTNGTHSATTVIPFVRVTMQTASTATVPPEPPPDPDPGMNPMCATDPAWDASCTPLLVDLDGDGFQLTTVEKGVRFDLDVDGDQELVAWTKAGSDDAWLAMDRNGNGRIDDGNELFGGRTPAHANRPETAANGFEALKFLEWAGYGPATVNEVIDANDAAFGRLLLWRDVNHDGISAPDELTPAAQAGIVAINADYKTLQRFRPRKGSTIRLASTVETVNGTRRIVDVWLATEQ
jgi:hypothetical protein